MSSPNLTDWIQAGATVVLVAVTVFYAVQTSYSVRAMRDSQQAQIEIRRRDKSERAANLVLAELQRVHEMALEVGIGAVGKGELSALTRVLRAEGALVLDEELRARLRACAAAGFTASWSDAALRREGVDPGMVAMRFSEMLQATRFAVEAYLAEQELPSWESAGLPAPQEAQAWVLSK